MVTFRMIPVVFRGILHNPAYFDPLTMVPCSSPAGLRPSPAHIIERNFEETLEEGVHLDGACKRRCRVSPGIWRVGEVVMITAVGIAVCGSTSPLRVPESRQP